jgi:SAM-dependent methyltransferase
MRSIAQPAEPRDAPSWPRLKWRHFLDRVVDPLIDRALGMETAGFESVDALGLEPDLAFDYRVSGWRSLQAILKRGDVTDVDVFVDFGCGKGRVLYLAGRYPFRRIIGVDLSPAMIERARRNLRNSPRFVVEVANAAEWPIPDDLTFAFFYNPFPNAVFSRVIENVLESLRQHPRRFHLIYRRPHRMHAFLLEQGFALIRQSDSGPTNLYAGPVLR